MRKSNRTVVLVLDNCRAHPNVNELTNVRLIFLPPNTTAKTQPLDAGVIRCPKSHYRKNLAKMCLLAFEEKKNFKIDVLEGMRLLSNAWNSVSEATIKNCFKKVYFTQPEDNIEEQETDNTSNREIVGIWERLQAGGLISKTYGLTNYSTSDEGLITRKTITESSILSELTGHSMSTHTLFGIFLPTISNFAEIWHVCKFG